MERFQDGYQDVEDITPDPAPQVVVTEDRGELTIEIDQTRASEAIEKLRAIRR